VVYALFCKHCDKFIYVGETGDTLYQRHLLNLSLIRRQNLQQGSHVCSCLKNIELCFLWTKISFKFLSCLNAKIGGFMNTFFIFSIDNELKKVDKLDRNTLLQFRTDKSKTDRVPLVLNYSKGLTHVPFAVVQLI
jgi:hypothetical protein